jgi:hypothetical protein
LSCRHWH